jgi:hypothetical protein
VQRFITFSLALGASITFARAAVPRPLPHHPGNIFATGEDVTVPAGRDTDAAWTLLDYGDHPLREVRAVNGRFALGKLPAGWFRLRSPGRSNDWISLAVLPPLPRPVPANSPISIDVAMAWFYPTNKMADVANLCGLAGVNWVRDRLNWAEMERERGKFSGPNRYDFSAAAQHAAGLRVLQVNHISPKWANADTKRLPVDLRDAFNFHREIASRWRASVPAIEPWNEADIVNFGGHTGAEMAGFQKAAFLGLKAGNPDVIACLNVWASHRRAQLDDFAANEAAAYFDTYNLHHYERIESYPQLYADHRRVSAGRPLWVSEFAVPVKWAGDDKLKEPADDDLRVQSERLVKAFATSLHEGARNGFYFMLPHYVEGQTQFGILRPDLTPRPAYLALATVGRVLADATPLGRLATTNAQWHVVFFKRPSAELAIAWTGGGATGDVHFPCPSLTGHDHLGLDPFTQSARSNARPGHVTRVITMQPQFLTLPRGTVAKMPLSPPPSAPRAVTATASPLVLQALATPARTSLADSAYRISATNPAPLEVFAYNFGTKPVEGTLRVTAPAGWIVRHPATLSVAPGARVPVPFEIDCRNAHSRRVETVRLDLEAGRKKSAVLSLRLMPEPYQLAARETSPVPRSDDPAAWQRNLSGGTMSIATTNGAVSFTAEPRGEDRWIYPRLAIDAASRPPAGAQGIRLLLNLVEGDATFRAIADEQNGSGYVMDLATPPKRGEAMEVFARFEDAQYGQGWSKPDPNNRFDPDQIAVLKIGCNTKSDRVQFRIQDVRWVAF